MTAAGENGLFIENAAPFAFAPLFIFILSAPLLAPAQGFAAKTKQNPLGLIIGVVFAGLVLSTISALIVPAYNQQTPRGLSIVHLAGETPGSALWSVQSKDGLPEEMMTFAPFAIGKAPGFSGERWLTPRTGFCLRRVDDQRHPR